jgi:hypothetical protein
MKTDAELLEQKNEMLAALDRLCKTFGISVAEYNNIMRYLLQECDLSDMISTMNGLLEKFCTVTPETKKAILLGWMVQGAMIAVQEMMDKQEAGGRNRVAYG